MPTALPEGSLAHRPRPLRRLLGRLTLASALLVLGLLATVVAVQVYYRLTPPALSEHARAVARELAALPRESENGFRLAGLLAPETMDPVAYGRCLTGAEIEIAAAWRKEVPRGLDPESAEWKALYERREAASKARRAACANGQAAPLQSDTSDGLTRLLKPGFDWVKLTATPPRLAPTVAKRAAQVLENAPAPLALPVDVLQFGYQPLLAAHTETLAAFARAWDAASARERIGLLGSIGQRNRQWVAFAKGGLTDAAIAHAALEYSVLVLEAALRRPGLVFDQALVEALDATLSPLDDLPAALAAAFLVEHRARAQLVADARKTPPEALRFGSPWATPLALERWLSPALLATVDPNDTENLSAELTRALQRLTASPKDSLAAREVALVRASPCVQMHRLVLVPCLALTRNPLERLQLDIVAPTLNEYVLRVHDLRNAAAGVRALLRWRSGASAQDVPKDIYTGAELALTSDGQRLPVRLASNGRSFGRDKPLVLKALP